MQNSLTGRHPRLLHRVCAETVGKCHPHVSCRVADEHGRTVPVNTPGELLTKGYSVMIGESGRPLEQFHKVHTDAVSTIAMRRQTGYWGDEHKTREAIKDGWMYTGDQVRAARLN